MLMVSFFNCGTPEHELFDKGFFTMSIKSLSPKLR